MCRLCLLYCMKVTPMVLFEDVFNLFSFNMFYFCKRATE
jgi:hypothetical protein